MGLYERWTASDDTSIAVHAFAAGLREMARGSVTRAQLVSAFSLGTTDQTELDAIIASYTAMTSTEKAAFLVKMHDVMLLSNHGLYDKTKAKAELGF
jgi:hypothetical protein